MHILPGSLPVLPSDSQIKLHRQSKRRTNLACAIMVKLGKSSKRAKRTQSGRVASTRLNTDNDVRNKVKLEEQEHENEILSDSCNNSEYEPSVKSQISTPRWRSKKTAVKQKGSHKSRETEDGMNELDEANSLYISNGDQAWLKDSIDDLAWEGGSIEDAVNRQKKSENFCPQCHGFISSRLPERLRYFLHKALHDAFLTCSPDVKSVVQGSILTIKEMRKLITNNEELGFQSRVLSDSSKNLLEFIGCEVQCSWSEHLSKILLSQNTTFNDFLLSDDDLQLLVWTQFQRALATVMTFYACKEETIAELSKISGTEKSFYEQRRTVRRKGWDDLDSGAQTDAALKVRNIMIDSLRSSITDPRSFVRCLPLVTVTLSREFKTADVVHSESDAADKNLPKTKKGAFKWTATEYVLLGMAYALLPVVGDLVKSFPHRSRSSIKSAFLYVRTYDKRFRVPKNADLEQMQKFCHSLLQLRDQHHSKITADGGRPTSSCGSAQLSEYGRPSNLRSDSTYAYQDFGTGDDSEEFASPSPSDEERNFEIKQDLISEQAIAVPDKDIAQIDHRGGVSSERESIAKKDPDSDKELSKIESAAVISHVQSNNETTVVRDSAADDTEMKVDVPENSQPSQKESHNNKGTFMPLDKVLEKPAETPTASEDFKLSLEGEKKKFFERIVVEMANAQTGADAECIVARVNAFLQGLEAGANLGRPSKKRKYCS